jgi:hypothetical protein
MIPMTLQELYQRLRKLKESNGWIKDSEAQLHFTVVLDGGIGDQTYTLRISEITASDDGRSINIDLEE